MAQITEEGLLQAIKKDNLKAFNAFMENAQCGAYRLGRFPVLSLLYLYKSRKILSVYEAGFLQIESYEVLGEPLELSKKFSAKAKKCLRLYLNEVVSPLEMLLILDKTKHLKQVFPKVKPSSAVKSRLKSIYNIKYSLSVKYEGENIILDRRPLTRHEKRNLVTTCLAAVLILVIVIGVPVTTTALIPKSDDGETTIIGEIDFGSTQEIVLKQDIIVPENYKLDKVNCTIIGDGRKLILRKGASLGELKGKVSDLVIESSGEPVFTTVSENAVVRNVTINVTADVIKNDNMAFVAQTNCGLLDGVTVNVSGNVNVPAPPAARDDDEEEEEVEELAFGGIVQRNSYTASAVTHIIYSRGIINNCTVNYSNFKLSGEPTANASFGGIVGINDGYVQGCTVTGEITSDTFDVAGVCSVNNYLLSGNINRANISQTSANKGWNPIACGIVLTNQYAVDNCHNTGKISSVSTCESGQQEHTFSATAAGIAYLSASTVNNPYIQKSTNYGVIECSAENIDAHAAGICISSYGRIAEVKNGGAVTARANNGGDAYVGGIANFAYAYISQAVNTGAVSTTVGGAAYIGGITAMARAQILYCLSSGEVTATAKDAYVGGIFGYSQYFENTEAALRGGIADRCIFDGKISVSSTDSKKVYVGGIAGYINEHVRETKGDTDDADTQIDYFGGGVINSYFIGEFLSEATYYGNIVGACGANIYEINSYSDGSKENPYFEGNLYLDNGSTAFGAIYTSGTDFTSAADKGASVASLEYIQSTNGYKNIISQLENLL